MGCPAGQVSDGALFPGLRGLAPCRAAAVGSRAGHRPPRRALCHGKQPDDPRKSITAILGSAITRSGGIWRGAGTACSAPGANIERGGSPVQANELFDRPNTILLDGGMGTMLQAAGLKLGARPRS